VSRPRLFAPTHHSNPLEGDPQLSRVHFSVEYNPPTAQGGQFFPATGHTLRGSFNSFWEGNGGLQRFGNANQFAVRKVETSDESARLSVPFRPLQRNAVVQEEAARLE